MSEARTKLFEALEEHSCCFTEEDANELIDAYAHELAEQQRAEVQGSDDPVYCQSSCGWLIDLIDPEAMT